MAFKTWCVTLRETVRYRSGWLARWVGRDSRSGLGDGLRCAQPTVGQATDEVVRLLHEVVDERVQPERAGRRRKISMIATASSVTSLQWASSRPLDSIVARAAVRVSVIVRSDGALGATLHNLLRLPYDSLWYQPMIEVGRVTAKRVPELQWPRTRTVWRFRECWRACPVPSPRRRRPCAGAASSTRRAG
jgi:hypothetical protein